ncbi:c-type cytochrome [Mesorhizobium sp. L-8-10]|uniref:c-type cytochrome n=1 Tax=Mesorhizobium sp. L-8-10 TaxID=2744523 RepID=UPI001926F788|nr:cytochrome c [Mesorhizobium sp. L-8-10]
MMSFFKALVLTVFAAGSAAAAEQESIAYGRALVEANCARCHAVGTADASRHAAAPAFRTLSGRYPLGALEEALGEGISTGHPDMPEFIATPAQIEAIIAYIGSLQTR